ncbi:hypothetical protein [Piscinibacter koreensis]|uniref:Secreted protein n=1 Tax=Piscinibacter koreensis TaxID=2742824 RepID=A0A7Y6NQ13_9BURK|nr:hypothetical protein [Schlegelella koreensis]NUZ07242.1 hypothetical protein [Schlegelella koreensis]
MTKPTDTRIEALRVRSLAALAGSALALAAAGAFAADKAPADSRYQQERSVCTGGMSQQDRATCLREAGAAKDEARRGQLSNGTSGASRDANATDRCNALPAKDRADCVARIQGPQAANQRTQTSGSVAGGGVLRETTTTTTTITTIPGGSAAPASPAR